jgi:hypothetical protein
VWDWDWSVGLESGVGRASCATPSLTLTARSILTPTPTSTSIPRRTLARAVRAATGITASTTARGGPPSRCMRRNTAPANPLRTVGEHLPSSPEPFLCLHPAAIFSSFFSCFVPSFVSVFNTISISNFAPPSRTGVRKRSRLPHPHGRARAPARARLEELVRPRRRRYEEFVRHLIWCRARTEVSGMRGQAEDAFGELERVSANLDFE